MRCPQCEKFVPYDTEVEPEEEQTPEASDGQFTASYRRVLTCEECGDELKEATIEIDEAISFDKPCVTKDASLVEGDDKDGPEHEWEVVDTSVSATTGVINHDRKGRLITKARYMKTTYDVEVSVDFKCGRCGAEHTQSFEASEAASSFDELV